MFLKQFMFIVHMSSYGPKICIKAPNVNIASTYAITAVRQIIIANFLKNIRLPKNSTTPQRTVVMQPLVILIDISL